MCSESPLYCNVLGIDNVLPLYKVPLTSHIIAQMHWPAVSKTLVLNETKPTQRSQITICKKRRMQNVQFRFMPNVFRILQPIQKSSKRVWVFRNTGANAVAKNQTPMKINVIYTVFYCHPVQSAFSFFSLIYYDHCCFYQKSGYSDFLNLISLEILVYAPCCLLRLSLLILVESGCVALSEPIWITRASGRAYIDLCCIMHVLTS